MPRPVALLPLRLPADCFTWGDHFAQETRWAAVGNTVMSAPGLGEDVLGADGPDAGHLVELFDLVEVRLGQFGNGGGERLDLGGVVVDDL